MNVPTVVHPARRKEILAEKWEEVLVPLPVAWPV
jgi:hypothetical protein